MQISNIAKRYSQAIFEVSKDASQSEVFFKELKVLKEAFLDKEVQAFFDNPTMNVQDKINTAELLTKKFKFSDEIKNFVHVLADKGRLSILPSIVDEFQTFTDRSNGVTRGEVVSSHVLSPEEREQIESIVSKKTNKRVILTYKEDPKLIGGLIARVDGYTFDDTLTMHLNRLNEDLKRRVH